MALRVGVPRALLYYKYFPLWKTFFEELGAEVVVSPPTNKSILNLGTESAENEVCLPVKVFYGHVRALKDKVDALFIPRIVSVENNAYTCPKLLALPDMIRALDDDLPDILGTTFNLRLGWRKFALSLYELGSYFTKDFLRIARAFLFGLQKQVAFERKLREGVFFSEALGERKAEAFQDNGLTIGVVGHSYNIYDSYISLNLINRLRARDVRILTPEMIHPSVIEETVSSLPKSIFWTYEKEAVGTVFHWLKKDEVDGIIYLLSFACGPDSLIQVLIEQEARKISSVPLMPIVIDEHSGEAGLITRLEAFLDMIEMKKEK